MFIKPSIWLSITVTEILKERNIKINIQKKNIQKFHTLY